MLTYTIQEIKSYLIGVLILEILYLLLYNYKGVNRGIEGYLAAIKSIIYYAVCGIFLIVGYDIVKSIMKHKMNHTIIIVPVIWTIIVYKVIRRNIKKDFGI